jgi:hypothetical protein
MAEWLKPPSASAIEQVRRDLAAGKTYPPRWPERKPAKPTTKRKSGAQSATKKGQ